jgi:hypothetical protein
MAFNLYITLPPVAVKAQHLAVVGIRLAIFAPRGYVVGFHIRQKKAAPALCAFAVLPFVCFTPLVA